jgi:hypothetical protein
VLPPSPQQPPTSTTSFTAAEVTTALELRPKYSRVKLEDVKQTQEVVQEQEVKQKQEVKQEQEVDQQQDQVVPPVRADRGPIPEAVAASTSMKSDADGDVAEATFVSAIPTKKTALQYEEAAFAALVAKKQDTAAHASAKKKAAKVVATAQAAVASASGPQPDSSASAGAPPPKRMRITTKSRDVAIGASPPAPTPPDVSSTAASVIGTDGSVYGISDAQLVEVKRWLPDLTDDDKRKPLKNWTSKCYHRVKKAQADPIQGFVLGGVAFKIGKVTMAAAK